MRGISRYLSISAVAMLILSALVAVPSHLARAQDSGSGNDWQASPSSGAVAEQPDAKASPLNLAGCWSGTIDDDSTGTGSGFLSFVQKGKNLTKATTAGLDFNGGPSISGSLSGKTNSQNFHLKFHRKQCNVSFHGTISADGDLTGHYTLSKKCLGEVFQGTFDYTFDAGGSTCP